jgi:hypothetical protein
MGHFPPMQKSHFALMCRSLSKGEKRLPLAFLVISIRIPQDVIFLSPFILCPRFLFITSFYMPDEEFPASVTCLFPSNAMSSLPVAGLADTAECTAKKIIEVITEF